MIVGLPLLSCPRSQLTANSVPGGTGKVVVVESPVQAELSLSQDTESESC